jgi:hypothetical protein
MAHLVLHFLALWHVALLECLLDALLVLILEVTEALQVVNRPNVVQHLAAHTAPAKCAQDSGTAGRVWE